MKLAGVLLGAVTAQYSAYPNDDSYADGYDPGSCGPDAAHGGAYWPSQSAADPCGVTFWTNEVTPNSQCQLQLTAGASFFLSLGGVFVTSPASTYTDDTFYFHTYDNWAVGGSGASVVNFWQNAGFPSNSSCYDADAICVTCTPNPDNDGDGYADAVQGVYLGNFMHDFRHASPSNVNVPIANSAGHLAGTVYTVTLMDQYGQPVPITNIASHYGHQISSPYDDNGVYFSNDGTFSLHVGCEDFLGQFLYFSFSHQGEMEANGWYSYVTMSTETPDCPTTTTAAYGDPYANDGYAATGSYAAPADPYNNQGRNDDYYESDDSYDNTDDTYDGNYDSYNYNYRKK